MPAIKLPNPKSPGQETLEPLKRCIGLAGISIACLFAAFPAIAESEENVAYLGQPALEGQKLPFSEAVQVGNLLFLSGQIGRLPGSRELVPGGIQPETRQTLENITATLNKYGSSMSQVIKCTVFLADMSEWAAMNEVYVEFFPVNPPARSALGTSGLALGARTEIECLAYVESKQADTID